MQCNIYYMSGQLVDSDLQSVPISKIDALLRNINFQAKNLITLYEVQLVLKKTSCADVFSANSSHQGSLDQVTLRWWLKFYPNNLF